MHAPNVSGMIRKQDPGLWAAIGSVLIWGMLPLYWRLLHDVSAYLILCHRILWSCVFLFPLVVICRRTGEVVKAARSAKTLRGLFLSSIFLACNWLIYIWAVNNGKVLETSLGYYISPLFTICMGVAVFKDRPSRLRWVAIAIAFVGVAAEVSISGVIPWVALSLAVSFALYGLLRKLAPVESLPGLALETLILAPFAAAFILWNRQHLGVPVFGGEVSQTLLLTGTGVVTSVPLILFAYGARHIPFTTLGVLQYFSPTCSFLLGLFVFGESFTFGRVVSFTCIWIALTLYTLDGVRAHPRPKPANTPADPGKD